MLCMCKNRGIIIEEDASFCSNDAKIDEKPQKRSRHLELTRAVFSRVADFGRKKPGAPAEEL